MEDSTLRQGCKEPWICLKINSEHAFYFRLNHSLVYLFILIDLFTYLMQLIFLISLFSFYDFSLIFLYLLVMLQFFSDSNL